MGRERWGHRVNDGLTTGETHMGLTGIRAQDKGVKGGGAESHEQKKTQALGAGADLIEGGLQVAGVSNVQVGGTLIRERRWRAGENKRVF